RQSHIAKFESSSEEEEKKPKKGPRKRKSVPQIVYSSEEEEKELVKKGEILETKGSKLKKDIQSGEYIGSNTKRDYESNDEKLSKKESLREKKIKEKITKFGKKENDEK